MPREKTMPATRIGRSDATRRSGWAEKGYDNPIHPERFQATYERRLARSVGLTQFGVNLVDLGPGSYSSLRHWHETEDEFVYVVAGTLVLIDDTGEHVLEAGSFVGFPAGERNAHHLVNRSSDTASYLVVGTRNPGQDVVHYPDDGIGPV